MEGFGLGRIDPERPGTDVGDGHGNGGLRKWLEGE